VSEATPRALAATVVAVVPEGEHLAAVEALSRLRQLAAVQPIVISLGSRGNAPREDHDGVVVFEQLLPRYVNNAVASLRLSSLPAMGWWRVPSTDPLRELAVLVDRLVLDVADPLPQWRSVPAIARLTAVSDLRWARLTRWRDLLAQYFDMPELRRLETPFQKVSISGEDVPTLRLFAGWLKSRLPGGAVLDVNLRTEGDAPLERVELIGEAGCVTLSLLPHSSCVQTSIESRARTTSTRIVPAGDTRADVLLRGELRIRSRDVAFEDAAREASAL
jgi:glucose-6-phosphate dehydrogenase assembly protein OpcA